MARHVERAERGFTLIEMMIAVLVIMAVMAALAPVFYGLLRATSVTNFRSVANGIAIQSTEQMRSVPYYEVGFYSTPIGCPTTSSLTPPVLLASATPAPIAALADTQVVGGVTFAIRRCVNWVDASIAGDTLAYKQTVVTVSWTAGNVASTVSQTSALYPGGESGYTAGGENGFGPATTTTVASVALSAPTSVTASDDGTHPSNAIDVSWSPASGTPVGTTYDLWYTSAGAPTGAISSTSGGQELTSVTSPYNLTVGPGTTYWIQIVAVYGGQSSSPSSTASAATTSSSPSTTAPGTTVVATTTTTTPCTITGISVTPAGTSSSPVFLRAGSTNTNGTLQNTSGEFSLSVNDTGSCGSVTVGYNPTACTLITNTSSTTTRSSCSPTGVISLLAGSGGPGTLNGITPYGTIWTKGTQDFLVYLNGAIYSPTTEAQSYVCVEAGSSGNCK